MTSRNATQKLVAERQAYKDLYKQRHIKNTTTEYAKVGRLVFKELEQLGQVIIEAPDDDTEL